MCFSQTSVRQEVGSYTRGLGLQQRFRRWGPSAYRGHWKPWHWVGSRRSECGERRGPRAEPWATAALRSREMRGRHSGEGAGELDGVFPGGKCERVQGKVGSVELQWDNWEFIIKFDNEELLDAIVKSRFYRKMKRAKGSLECLTECCIFKKALRFSIIKYCIVF